MQGVLESFGFAVENSLRMGCGADSTGRNAKSAYRVKKGELSGCINIALWHAVGHEVSELLIITNLFPLSEITL